MTDITGERLRNCRKNKKYTLEDLARIVGVTAATINKYEMGVTMNLKKSVVEKIAEALDTTPSYLMGWDDYIIDTVHTNNGVIGKNEGTLTVNNSTKTLSKEEVELLRIFGLLDVKRRIKLLSNAMRLEEEQAKEVSQCEP